MRRHASIHTPFRSTVARMFAAIAAMVLSAPAVSWAQQPSGAPATQGEAEDLAKKLANPISDLVSVPFQFNWEQNVGPNSRRRAADTVRRVRERVGGLRAAGRHIPRPRRNCRR